MARFDPTGGLRLAAGPPTSVHGPSEAHRRNRRRRRRKRLVGVAAAVVAVVALATAAGLSLASTEPDGRPEPEPPVAGQTSSPAPDTARLRVEQTLSGGRFYTEGSVGHVEVRDAAAGTLAVDQRLFAAPTVVDAELEPGRYTLVSYQRPCLAACARAPDTGVPVSGGSPTDRCEATFAVGAAQVADATVDVTPGRGCQIDLQVRSAADAAQAACAVDASRYAGSITEAVSAPACRPETTSRLRLQGPTRGADRTETRVDAAVEGAPPFSVDPGTVRAATDDAWASHTLTIANEWRTPIGVRLGDVTVRRQPVGQSTEPTSPADAVRILDPRQDITITVSLGPPHGSPEPRISTASLAVPFWRDVDGARPPTGAPDGVARIRLTYERLAAAQLDARGPLCDRAPAALEQATGRWRQDADQGVQALLDALALTRRAAHSLDDPRATRLLTEIDRLEAKLARLRDGAQVGLNGHEGFSTLGVVTLVNDLCGTEVEAAGIAA